MYCTTKINNARDTDTEKRAREMGIVKQHNKRDRDQGQNEKRGVEKGGEQPQIKTGGRSLNSKQTNTQKGSDRPTQMKNGCSQRRLGLIDNTRIEYPQQLRAHFRTRPLRSSSQCRGRRRHWPHIGKKASTTSRSNRRWHSRWHQYRRRNRPRVDRKPLMYLHWWERLRRDRSRKNAIHGRCRRDRHHMVWPWDRILVLRWDVPHRR